MPTSVTVIIAPFHAGAYCERVGKGPHRIAETGLIDALYSAGVQDIDFVELDRVDDFEGEIGRSFEVKRRIAIAVNEAVAGNRFPLVLAGNCNATVGVYAGLGQDCDVVWFDAHPDFNTPDEVTGGYFDGMGVATLAGTAGKDLRVASPDLDLSPSANSSIVAFGTSRVVSAKR